MWYWFMLLLWSGAVVPEWESQTRPQEMEDEDYALALQLQAELDAQDAQGVSLVNFNNTNTG